MKRDLHKLVAKHAPLMPGLRVEGDRLVWGPVSIHWSRRGICYVDGIERPTDGDAKAHVEFLQLAMPLLGLLQDVRSPRRPQRRNRWRSPRPDNGTIRRVTFARLVRLPGGS